MNVTLRQFVEQTLLDITKAVHCAQKASPHAIAPGFLEGEKQLEPQMIEFSIQVVASQEKTLKGKGDVSVPIISIVKASAEGEINTNNEQTTTQNLKFSVPVYFQSKTNN